MLGLEAIDPAPTACRTLETPMDIAFTSVEQAQTTTASLNALITFAYAMAYRLDADQGRAVHDALEHHVGVIDPIRRQARLHIERRMPAARLHRAG